jgi:triosephosphate isomerase
MKNNNKPLIVANWKMNKISSSAEEFLRDFLSHGISYNQLVICPPFTLLGILSKKLRASLIQLGAQDCSSFSSEGGAFTGDVSSSMLIDSGCSYVIVGHSERRKQHLETNQIIKQKIYNAHKVGLKAILCVGESLELSESGDYKQDIGETLEECLPDSITTQNTIIAYEPIWAIGTGKTASVEQIKEMHEFLSLKSKEIFIKSSQTFEQNVKIIYGGSVNEENSASILSIPCVSGLLIGGASLSSEKLYKIIQNI